MKNLPLIVHIIFHPGSAGARDLARHIHRQLNVDPMVPGLRVPTIFCEGQQGNKPPLKFRLGHAERTVVVVLADDVINLDDEWCSFIGDVWEHCLKASARFVPFQLAKGAWPLDPRLEKVNFARAYSFADDQARRPWIVQRIVVEVCRYLSDLDPVDEAGKKSPVPIKIFLSHTKLDLGHDPYITNKVLDCLKADQPIEAWVDSGSILVGSLFGQEIESGIKNTSLLVLLTDSYATREWCREEILLAKEHQRPVAVIDALKEYESRSFPYLGNVPRIRWDDDPQKGIDLVLKETLRHLHDHALLERWKVADDIIFARPPEFATLAGMTHGSRILYPDPPVGEGEKRRLERTGVLFETPLQRLASDRSLQGLKIGLSMSESTDIALYGMDNLHLEECMAELSRYLLIKGATLAYGGHLGSEGYTRRLIELVSTYNTNRAHGTAALDRIVNYRGWPLLDLAEAQRSELKPLCQTVLLPRPADVDESLHPEICKQAPSFAATDSAEHRFAWARGMTEMREFQADRTKSGVAAMIVLGGRFGPTVRTDKDGNKSEEWYSGRIPGVLEEVLLAIKLGQPVFLIGAFGGVAELVIDLLRGEDRMEATWDYQKNAPHSVKMRELYERRGIGWVDYPEIVATIRAKGIAGINPLLTEEEQHELFDTVSYARIVELILAGLGKL
ncbi:TIR domain-containing protein [Luteolibacter arcticus]|uniref:TIR domain-containing protein n=1 Tax=Luteolibacter arcticus TaxID=1581411 RepID=A0ABT3GQ72_9BACT|nr:TIR domain-containing protein [Luteolibacter arcticus]MCW1925677.1 TIR domain-containing protein [Luteolibacter arcticus]